MESTGVDQSAFDQKADLGKGRENFVGRLVDGAHDEAPGFG